MVNESVATTPGDVTEIVRAAYQTGEPIELRGGGTALDYGCARSEHGRTLELKGLGRIVDYTPRDMTILVEAGVRMADLTDALAVEGQHLPIDVPRADQATIGGVVATNWNGPRRYGYGTIRDYVIGIHAVDGRGVPFKGGGRVVKNVAGYDFCKLLTGSLGTLAAITQIALKVTPRQECSATVVAGCPDLDVAEAALARIMRLESPPTAVDLLVGGNWSVAEASRTGLAIRVEGGEDEVCWLVERARAEVSAAGGVVVRQLPEDEAAGLWSKQVEFSDRGTGLEDDGSPFVVRIVVPSSAVMSMIARLVACDVDCAIQAHAASGMITARFSKFGQSDVSRVLVRDLRPVATKLGGYLVVVRSRLDGLTPHLVWGNRTDAIVLLERVKRKFDPKNILNPGRYVF